MKNQQNSTEMEIPKQEQGITPTVQTIFSQTTVEDIINFIAQMKAQAILSWLEKKQISPQKILIIGIYLTGAKIANHLVKSSRVTVVDIYPHLKRFLDTAVSYKTSIYEIDSLETFDMIIDTTGLGGLSPDEMKHINTPQVFLAENPTSDGSDVRIKCADHTLDRLEYFKAKHNGQIYTAGLNSKTSGTMTLTMDILRKSMNDALQDEGVLYTVASLDFYERILFQERNYEKFLMAIKKPALVVSSLEHVKCDQIINNNLNKIHSQIIDYP